MGLYENFPYTNFQNLNLDWILKEIKKIPDEIESAVNAAMEQEMNSKIKAEVTAQLAEILPGEITAGISTYVSDITNTLAARGIFTNDIKTIEVGSGKTYSDLVAAVNSVQDNSVPTIIYLYPGSYSTNNAASQNDGFGLAIDNIYIVGVGNRNAININYTGDSDTASAICLKNSCGLYNLRVTGEGGMYAVHDDFHNRNNTPLQIRTVMDCEIYGSKGAIQAYGAGIKSNQWLRIINTYICGLAGTDGFRIHNYTGVDQSSRIDIINCDFEGNGDKRSGMLFGIVSNIEGSTITLPVMVNIIGSHEIFATIFAESGQTATSCPFTFYCDTPIQLNDLTGTMRLWDQHIAGMKWMPYNTAATPAVGKTVMLVNNSLVQNFSPGASISKYNAYGVVLRLDTTNKRAFVLRKGYTSTNFGSAAALANFTVANDGSIGTDASGLVVGHRNNNSMSYFNFEH